MVSEVKESKRQRSEENETAEGSVDTTPNQGDVLTVAPAPNAKARKRKGRTSNGHAVAANGHQASDNANGYHTADGNSHQPAANRPASPTPVMPLATNIIEQPPTPDNEGVSSTANQGFSQRFVNLARLVSNLNYSLNHITDTLVIAERSAEILGETLGAQVAIWRLKPTIERRDPKLRERKDRRHLSLAASYHLDPDYQGHITAFAALENSAAGEDGAEVVRKQAVTASSTIAAWVKHEQVVLSDLQPMAATRIKELKQASAALRQAGIGIVCSLPLLSGRRITGVLDLYYPQDHSFLPGETMWLDVIAAQIANSFEYADFQEKTGRKTAEALLLREISQMLNRSLDLNETLDAILLAVRRLVRYEAAEISLLNERTNELKVRSTLGQGDDAVSSRPSYKVGEGYTGWIARERQPLRVSDVRDMDFKPAKAEITPGHPWLSFLGLPIMQGDNLLGTLELVSTQPNAFNDDDTRLLGNIAEQAATAIDNARLHEETSQRNRELALLQEVSATLNASLDLKETLRTILLNVKRIINYQLGEVTLYDSQRNLLISQFTTGSTSGVGQTSEFQDEYSLDDKSYSAWLGRNQKPLLVNNPQERDSYGIISNSVIRSYVGVPMLNNGRLIGTIEASNEVDDAFSENDLSILTLIANQAAVAVENAQLYSRTDERLARRLQELTILQRIGQEMNSTLDVNQIFNMVINEAVRATDALMGSIVQVDREANVMRVQAVAGDLSDSDITMLEHPTPITQGLMGRAVEIGEALLIGDVKEDSTYVQLSPRVRAEMVVPIRYEEEVVGLIDLNSAAADGFDIEHLHFIEALAGQTATAMGVAQSYSEQVRQGQQLARRASQLNQVLEIGSSLTPERSIEDVLDQVANAIADTLNYRLVIVSLVEGEGDQRFLRRIASAGLPLSIFEEFRARTTPLNEAEVVLQERFRIGRSYFIPAESQDRPVGLDTLTLIDEEARLPYEWQRNDMLIVPMYSTNGDLLGWISADDPTDHQRPNRNTVEAIEVFANQAAGAVENARLIDGYRQRILELDALSNIGRDVTANLDVKEMCEAVYNQLQRIMRVEAYYVALDVDDMLVSLMAMDNGSAYDLPTVPMGGSLSERVIKGGQPLLINGTANEGGEMGEMTRGLRIASGDAPRAWLGVPLRIGENIIGVLSVQHYGSEPYTKREEQLLTTVANQLATAIQNARLFERNQERVGELAMLNEVGSSMSATREEHGLYEQAYSSAIKLLGAHTFTIALREGDRDIKVLFHRSSGEGSISGAAPLEGSLAGVVINTRRALLMGKLSDPNQWPLHASPTMIEGGAEGGNESWLGVPLLAGEQALGALIVQDPRPNAFSNEQVTLFTLFANQFATALSNADLFERNQRRINELAALTELGRELTASHNIKEISRIARTRLQQLIPLDVFLLGFYIGDDEQLQIPYLYNDGQELQDIEAELGNGPGGWVIANRQPLLLSDVLDPREAPEGADELTIIEGDGLIHGWMGAPLLSGDQAVGLVSVQFDGRNVYTNDHLQLLATVANQLAIALQNAQSFAKNQQRITELALINEAAREITANLDVEQIGELLYQQSQRLFANDALILGLYDRDKQEVNVIYSRERINETGRDAVFTFPLGQGLSSRVINTRGPILVRDIENPSEVGAGFSPRRIGVHPEQPTHSWLGVPLMSGDQAIGILSVQSYKVGAFSEEQIPLLGTLAGQTVVALQNAQLFERNEQRINELSILSELGRELTTQRELTQIGLSIYERMKSSFPIDSYFLMLYDEDDETGYCPVFVDGGVVGHDVKPIPMGNTLSSYVLSERRPVLIGDILNPAEVPAGKEAILYGEVINCHSWMGVPLTMGNRIIGVLSAQSIKPYAYTDNELRFLGTVANQASVAIENARLFQRNEQRINELGALSELGRELTSQLDVAAIGRTIYESTKGSFSLDAYFMMLYDEKHDNGICPVYVDEGVFGHDESAMELGDSLSGYVIHQRKPLLIGDLDDDSQLPAGKHPVSAGEPTHCRAWMGVPMMIGNRLLGVLAAQSTTPYAYRENELQFFTTVASQASVALENARLFEQYKQRIDELNSLNELTRSVTASMHVDAVAVSVYEHIKKFVGLDVFMLALYDDEHNLITWPFSIEDGQRLADIAPQPLGRGMSSRVIESQKPMIFRDLEDPNEIPFEATTIRVGGPRRVRSWAGAPLMVGRQVIGVISVQSYEPHQYDDDTIRPLFSVANQAAIAIQNAKLFEERDRKIAELATVNQMAKEISSSLQLDELLQLIYNQVTQVMSTRNFLITIYEERKQEIQYRFMREHGRSVTRPPRKLGPGLISQIIESRQPLLINYDTGRYVAERGWEHIGEPARSWLGVPMVSGDQALGVIVVQSYDTEGAYDNDDLSLLSTIASQAAVAIEKAKLFEETQQRVLQLDTLNEIGRILGAVLDEETVFQKIFEHTTRFFDDLSSFYIALYNSDQGLINFPFAVEDEQRIEMSATPLGEGLTSYVIANRRALLIDDMDAMTREYEGYRAVRDGKANGERSWMGVPLFLGGEVIGLISLQSRKPGAYRQEDLQFLATLANQAAVAIKNAKLFDEIRQFNATLNRTVAERTEALGRANQELRVEKERISQLYEITHQLTTSLDLEDILNRGLRLVASAIGVDRGSIMTIDPSTNGLVYRAALGNRNNHVGMRMPWKPGQGAVGWAVANRTPLLITDTRTDPHWVKDEDLGVGIGSMICVPLMSGSDVFGVMNLAHADFSYFNESHLRLVSTVANEMAVFAHNAELYSYISEQAEALASSLIVQEQEASRSRAILESIADGVLVFDSDSRITLVNPAAETILAVPGEVLLNRQVPYGLRNLDLGPELLDLVQSVVNASREGASGALNLSRRRFSLSGRVINVSLSLVVTSKRETLGLVAVLRDITREVEVEREKSDFVSTVSHELRTPMTVIKGHTDLLLAGAVGPVSPMQTNFLQAVKRNTDRMNTLVSDLLTHSRIETGRMAVSMQANYYDISEIVDGVVQTLRSLAEQKNQLLSLTLAADLPEVLVDRDRTVQVLTNLVSNAIKYTPNGGRIIVNVSSNADAGMVQVDVTDNGIGIAEKDQEKLFTPFYRSDNAEAKMQEGTGLGLVIARSLVELQGGQLWLNSKLGEGTTFSFTMPAYMEQMAASSVEVTAEGKHGKARIMVVDDDPQVANGLAAALEREGYETLVAYSGRKAVEIAGQERLDLITMDIVMPEMDGFETMKALSDDPNSAGVPVLIVSLIPENEQGFALGAVGYIAKPASAQALIDAVEQALKVRTTHHDGPARVLIIDDEADVVSTLETALRREGFAVFAAYSGEDGLNHVAEYHPDVILLDMKMPGLGGTEVLARLKRSASTRNIPVIILTASESSLDEARVKVINLGAQELLSKPFSINTVVEQIKKALPEDNKDKLNG